MKNVSQNTLLRIYNKVSIFISLGFLLSLYLYFSKLPETMFGTVQKGLFSTTFTVALQTDVVIFNSALLFALVILAANIAMVIFAYKAETKEKAIQESTIYNLILNIVIVVALVIFYLNIPKEINGAIFVGFFQYKFNVLSDELVGGFNFSYILATGYMLYNIVLAILSTKTTKKVEDFE